MRTRQCIQLSSDGLTFNKDAALTLEASSTGQKLKIATFDPDYEKWIALASSSTATSGKLTAALCHFSLYAVVNVPISPSTPAPGAHGGPGQPPVLSITPQPVVLTPPKEGYLVIIIILVVVGALILGFTGAALYIRRMRSSPEKQKHQKLVFDDDFVEPIPGLEDDEDLVSPDWSLCSQCEKHLDALSQLPLQCSTGSTDAQDALHGLGLRNPCAYTILGR